MTWEEIPTECVLSPERRTHRVVLVGSRLINKSRREGRAQEAGVVAP